MIAAAWFTACEANPAPVAPPQPAPPVASAKEKPVAGAAVETARLAPQMPGLPRPPSRDEVGSVRISFQGQSVTTKQRGTERWFEPAIADLTDQDDRQAVYAAKRAAGDTHINVSLDLTGLAGVPWRRQIIREAIVTGGMRGVLLMMMGDGSPQDQDAGALGRDWLMRHFPAIYQAFKGDGTPGNEDLTPWIIFVPGYDGVVPGWQPPSSVDAFALMARKIIDAGGSGYLGIELSAGYAAWGGDTATTTTANNWTTAAGQAFDVILQEFPIAMGPPRPIPAHYLVNGQWAPSVTDEQRKPWTQVWQMVGRMVSPYHVPDDQPDDRHPPYLLGAGTPRGPYYYVCFEFDTYEWIRTGRITLAEVVAHRAYLRQLGCRLLG